MSTSTAADGFKVDLNPCQNFVISAPWTMFSLMSYTNYRANICSHRFYVLVLLQAGPLIVRRVIHLSERSLQCTCYKMGYSAIQDFGG